MYKHFVITKSDRLLIYWQKNLTAAESYIQIPRFRNKQDDNQNLKGPVQKPYATLLPLPGDDNWNSVSHEVHIISEWILYEFVHFTDLRCTFVI